MRLCLSTFMQRRWLVILSAICIPALIVLQVFRYNLNLQYSFVALELEEALAGSTGDGGLLADLHMVSIA